jgi:hypothetical protein
MLERAYPDRFGRRDPGAFGPRQARGLLSEILDIIGSEITDPFQRARIEKRLHKTFEYTLRAACDTQRTSRELREAIKFFEEKDRRNDPLLQFGFPTPDYAALFKSRWPAASSPDVQSPVAPGPSGADAPAAGNRGQCSVTNGQ